MPWFPASRALGCALALAASRAAAAPAADEQDCDGHALLQSVAHPAGWDSQDVAQLSTGVAFEEAYEAEGWAQQIYGPDAFHHLHLDQTRSQRLAGSSPAAGLTHRVILHHIWKVGGTHLCEVARESGLRAPENPGCHRWVHDGKLKDEKWTPCALDQRLHGYFPPSDMRLSSIPFDVVGHECAVDAEMIKQGHDAGFAWVGMLRDPVQQAYSWFAHVKRANQPQKTLTQWLQECNKTAPCGGFFTFVPNLQTSWLGGRSCYHDPERDGCVEAALANLKSMAAVLEQDGSATKGLEKLEKLGWEAKDKTAGTFKSGSAAILDSAPPEELAMVKRLQSADLRLLQAARAEGLI